MAHQIKFLLLVATLWTTESFVTPFFRTRQSSFLARQVLFSEASVDASDEVENASATSIPEVVVEDVSETEATDDADASPETDPEPKKRHTIFVGNLPFDLVDADVRDMFAPYGTVELVSVPRDRTTGQARGFAFVDMNTAEELKAAVDGIHGTMVGGRTVRAQESLPKGEAKRDVKKTDEGARKIYVGNLSFETTRDDIFEYFSQFGAVKDVYVPLDTVTGDPRGFSFVTLDENIADEAIEKTNGEEFMGRRLVVSVPLPPGQKAQKPAGPMRQKLYVGNLSFYTTPETLRELFEEFGEVYDCYMPEDPDTGGSRGFGFVTLEMDAAKRAVDETDGCELDGRIIRVNEAQPKGARPPRNDDFYDE